MQEAKTAEEWIKEISGQPTVHPGHPLVIACSIMKIFGSYRACIEKDSLGHCEALSDGRVPGAGQHVRDAMKMLSMGSEGTSVEEMISFTYVQWIVGQAGGHASKVDPGIEQAKMLEPWFRANIVKWLQKGNAQESAPSI